jgi:hypothetical protein
MDVMHKQDNWDSNCYAFSMQEKLKEEETAGNPTPPFFHFLENLKTNYLLRGCSQ